MIEVGHASHTGLRRGHNEDSYWADADLGLFLVVDGLGGYGRGEMAAAIACDALVDAARAGRGLEPAIRGAGEAIAAFAASLTDNAPTGATLALLKLHGDRFAVTRIGDARAYLWQRGMQLSLCLDDQEASPVDAESGAIRRNRITQALGITPASELCAEPVRGTLERGMQFLLCSDGLTEELGDGQIAAVLARTDLAAQECVDHLLLTALDAGGRDNITAILVRVA